MKERLEEFLNENSRIIFDTNVFLNLYEYSPHIADFFLDVIEKVEDRIFITDTVYREFRKNHMKCKGRQKKKFSNVPKELKRHTEKAKAKLLDQLNILEKFQFPEIDGLKDTCISKLTELEETFEKYVEELNVFEEINDKFIDEDRIGDLVNKLINNGHLIKGFDLDEIYAICEEGKKRYEQEIPPGFRDAKHKDGLQKYNDLIVWKETLKFSKDNNVNLIFITDDVKSDWWKKSSNSLTVFRDDLVKEFEKETNHQIFGIKSAEFFLTLADIFNINIPDAIESVLTFKVEDYIESLLEYEQDELKDIIGGELSYSGDTYVDIETLSHYDGSYFEMADEIDEMSLNDYWFEGYKDSKAIYVLEFQITTRGYSKEYQGKDWETKEVYLSKGYNHLLKGEIKVKVIRDIDFYLEDLLADSSFSNIEIISGDFKEIDVYSDEDLCIECGENMGEVLHRNGGLVCSNCAVVNGEGDICPNCGEKVPYDLMNGNFCLRCTQENDNL